MVCSGIPLALGRLIVLSIASGTAIIVCLLPLGMLNLGISQGNTHAPCDVGDTVFRLSLSDCVFYQGLLQILFVVTLTLAFLFGLLGLGTKGHEDACTTAVCVLCFLLGGNIACFLGLQLLSGVIMFADGWACVTGMTGVGVMAAINLCITSLTVFVSACVLIK